MDSPFTLPFSAIPPRKAAPCGRGDGPSWDNTRRENTLDALKKSLMCHAMALAAQLEMVDEADYVSLAVIKHDDERPTFVDVTAMRNHETVISESEFIGGEEE
jgi:hypothetical protein